jgi:cobalt-zinc-cadmium efflux system outer membrane protein
MRTERLLLFVATLAAGCSAVDPRAGLPDIQRMVSDRGRLEVTWPENAEDRRNVDTAVADIIAHELSVESAVRVALLNNRNLRALYEGLGVAEADLVQAGLLPNPVLTANVRFGLGPSGTGAEIGLVQELISALQIPLRKKVAAANLERAKVEVANAVLDLALQTKTAYFRLQGALQALELRRSIAAATSATRDVAEAQHKAGTVNDLAVAGERAIAEEAKVELSVAEAEALADREDLNILLGLWGDQTTWTMPARLPALPADDVPLAGLESRAVSQRLDLLAVRAEGTSASAQVRLNRLYGFIPNASMGVDSEREIAEGVWSLGPALEMPIPLFDQSQALIASSTAKLRAADERFAALAIEIRAQVRRARTRLVSARQRADYYQRVLLPLQAQVVTDAQRQYNAMQVGVFQLLQAKREQIESGRRYVETLTDYWLARTELERALGGELPQQGGRAS